MQFALLTMPSPQVSEVAVIGVPSEKWGQKVTAIVVLSGMGRTAGKDGKKWSPLDMRRSLKERLANYKIPQAMKVVDAIPRNAMGKSKFGVSGGATADIGSKQKGAAQGYGCFGWDLDEQSMIMLRNRERPINDGRKDL
jgi:AMP-binding enzyme C-terminal domain